MPRLRLRLLLSIVITCAPCLAQVAFDTFASIPELPSATAAEMANFRGFIWQHWIIRKRGIAQVRGISKEGTPTLVTYLICPDERERWVITETWQTSGVDGKGVFNLPPAVFVSSSLVVIENGENSPPKVIPAPNLPFLNSFLLRLKRNTGDESIF